MEARLVGVGPALGAGAGIRTGIPVVAVPAAGVGEALSGDLTVVAVAPEKGSRARLPDAIVAELERIVLICKGPGGAGPQASLPRGILKELMSFLDPFCSPVTLQKRMSAMSEAVARERAPPAEPDASRGAVY